MNVHETTNESPLQNGAIASDLLQVLPTLMPCEIVPCETTVSQQLWNPQVSDTVEADGSRKVTAYFRGRRLVGKEVEVPEGYSGFIPVTVKSSLPSNYLDSEEADDNKVVPLPGVEPKYKFTNIRILGHEELPTSDSPHIKAIQEWAKIAAVVHKT